MISNAEFVLWDGIKSKLEKKYPSLTQADLIWRHGTVRDLIEMIAQKLGKTTREILEGTEKP